MNEDQKGAASSLTRADVELLLSRLVDTAQLDLRARNLQRIDLSYLDLRGAHLQGCDLRGANLRGTNLSGAKLQQADLGEADLDGADLSCAQLGETEATRVRFFQTKLSYARLGELDLRGFDLSALNLYHADLRGTDLRGAILRDADLRGADLSTALLNGPELQGAMLYRGAFLRDRGKQTQREEASRPLVEASPPAQLSERAAPRSEQETSWSKQPLSEREAYLFGMNILLAGFEPAKLLQLFPLGFSFARTRQLFDAWLMQAGSVYNEQETQALWIGFAHRMCDLYFQSEPDTFSFPFALL